MTSKKSKIGNKIWSIIHFISVSSMAMNILMKSLHPFNFELKICLNSIKNERVRVRNMYS